MPKFSSFQISPDDMWGTMLDGRPPPPPLLMRSGGQCWMTDPYPLLMTSDGQCWLTHPLAFPPCC